MKENKINKNTLLLKSMWTSINREWLTPYLMCVCADRHSEGSCQAEVSQLDLTLSIDEEVLGLQVSMKNPVGVAKGQALQQLEKITLQKKKKCLCEHILSSLKYQENNKL